jgi:hypothetical protein
VRLYLKIALPLLPVGVAMGALVATAGWGLASSIILGLALIALGTTATLAILLRLHPPDAERDTALSPFHAGR